ncbi:MAG: ABC-F family ATP-binding cassette domain-containing protein [Patescibacteria group bacterium]|nr:ATP-binding cassette domain-containing protein [Patescibacteria group bacterium]MDE1944092.1 ABC-F family ATP-binding cassette domain-containing protein [Patescibacteria group bacterium]MDE1944709.1 ABC-F family ATP-binding cassette domain-containing protein [Patescibacteria group bacterium]MDE2057600.1 ABC-F family ATP-binding cassette domain-containing protein [Patescibacteria group bacterium]
MAREESVVRFERVSFGYSDDKPILDEVDFTIRRGAKLAVMGQNGAGKSTLFALAAGVRSPESGAVHRAAGLTIATARQVIPRAELTLTVRAFFEKQFARPVYDIDPRIDAVLEVVNLAADHDRLVQSFSGGQQARLLLASALIQDPELLLLDEPTNNLDQAGIEHLTRFLVEYRGTVAVISHDAAFLNAFTTGVLYLDAATRRVEQYAGTYADVQEAVAARIERENRKNALLAKKIQENKDKANFFAHKGGKMRLVAKKMRAEAEEMEEAKVDVRKEDKTIRPFAIPAQPGLRSVVLELTGYAVLKAGKPVEKRANVALRKGGHLLVAGPNGIGKSTLLEAIAGGSARGATIAPGVRVGYYRQDFSTLDFAKTVYDALLAVMEERDEEKMRATAAGFLIGADTIRTQIGDLSEGQKGLVAFASLVLARPGLLILDEPTNHINFRHLPVIAKALSDYAGAMILVSHAPEFVREIRIDDVLDLAK